MSVIKKLLEVSFGVASLALLTSKVEAAQIRTDGTWYEFRFDSQGSLGSSCIGNVCLPDSEGLSEPAPEAPWEFSVNPGGTYLTIQDAFRGGERFSAFSNSSFIGTTSTVPSGGNCSNNLSACISNPDISSGRFFLSAGEYSLEILTNVSPFGGGAAFFKVESVPEPTAILGTLTFATLGASARLKRRQKRA